MQEGLAWLLENPARIIVLISIVVTWIVASAERHGRNTGGSGWLTLARISVGGISSIVTAVVAGIFGGVGAFFGYLVIQLIVCVIFPIYWVDHVA